jgi:chaperonin GroEL (HSP60 family)
MSEKDLPGGRAMGNPVRSSSELQRQATELVEQQAAISQVLRAVCELASRLAANLRHDPHQCHAPLPSHVRRFAPLRGKWLLDRCAKRSIESDFCRTVAVRLVHAVCRQ